MAAKKEHIVRYTADELREMERRGLAGSDWKRAALAPLPDGSDPDDAMEPVDMALVTTQLPIPRMKKNATIRLDEDVLSWFRAQGRGYQTRINAILRRYYEQHMR